jgi:hypothetical protein
MLGRISCETKLKGDLSNIRIGTRVSCHIVKVISRAGHGSLAVETNADDGAGPHDREARK